MATRDETDSITTAICRLHRAGWSVGSTAFYVEGGGLAWLVSGVNGENVIHGRGPTEAAAWRSAIEQARAAGMLDGIQAGEPSAG